MNVKLRTLFAVLAGVVVAVIVNGGLIAISPMIVPPPAGVDMTTVEGMAEGMELLGPLNFLMPFLAHALGTLSGALVASFLAPAHRQLAAYVVAAFNLLGGIVAATMIPAPVWFIVLDLLVAYLPMAWLALQIGGSLREPVAGDDEK